MSKVPENCTFHYFKPNGKWLATARGHCPEELFKDFGHDPWDHILINNWGAPGLATDGRNFTRVLVLDEDVDYGFPQMFKAEK
jgi:hypothetical protein